MNPAKSTDHLLWEAYKQSGNPEDRAKVMQALAPLLHSRVQKWKGPVPADILHAKAYQLAAKALDTFDPHKGAALGTHVVNSLGPLSRVVYTYQNTARLPENVTLRVHAYQTAKDSLSNELGREPTLAELHDSLGWPTSELSRMDSYVRRDLTESVGAVQGSFYSSAEDKEQDVLAAIYFDLLPDEKILFEALTGYGGKRKLTTNELLSKLGITQAQLSYKKTLLAKHIQRLQGRK